MVEDLLTRFLLILLGYAYPSFQCFMALEGNRASGGELRFWCQYWIIMALLNILERAADVIISWLPMYGELKLAFIIYLWYPKTKGTGYIYETVLRPFVTNHETDLEKKLPEWRAKAWDLAIYYLQNCSDLGQSAIFQVLEYTAGQSGKSSKSSNKKSSRKSSSPQPPPPPNDTPTFYKPGKNMKQSQTSGTVQIKPNARTEYPQVINDEKETVNELGRSPSFDVPWSYPTKNKLYLPRISFRRLRA